MSITIIFHVDYHKEMYIQAKKSLFAHIEVNIPANDYTVFYELELFSCIDMTRLMVVFFMFPLNINVKKRKFSCETWNLSDVFLR